MKQTREPSDFDIQSINNIDKMYKKVETRDHFKKRGGTEKPNE